MCISAAISAIINEPNELPTDSQMVKLSASVNESKGRKASNLILKSEFLSFASSYLASIGSTGATLNTILQLLNGSLVPVQPEEGKQEKK